MLLLAHGGCGDEEVWVEFADDRARLRATAAAMGWSQAESGQLRLIGDELP